MTNDLVCHHFFSVGLNEKENYSLGDRLISYFFLRVRGEDQYHTAVEKVCVLKLVLVICFLEAAFVIFVENLRTSRQQSINLTL